LRVEEDNRASTSVLTRPGTIFKISLPKLTRILSITASTKAAPLSDEPFRSCTALSTSGLYSAFSAAARINEGFVVASSGW